MMLLGKRCALYARRSTDEHQAASLDVQTDEGRSWIEREGGTLAPEHVYVDDAVSRAEFKKRPGLIAMLNAAKDRAFDAVIVRDESRLGGDTFRLGLVIQDLSECGVALFYYFTAEPVPMESAVDKFMVAARSFAAELEREKTSQRTREHLMTKARRGLVVGGRVYGYDNHEVRDGDRRVRVEYRINDREAEIVREIFRRYAAGEGLRTIAKDLNARGVPSPRAGSRGTGSWSYSAIREMLRRERYRGRVVWGKAEKAYRGGTKVRVARPENEWITVDVPEFQIIDDALWSAAAVKVDRKRRSNGSETRGRPPAYLLTGLARCGVCGGPMMVANGKVSHDNVRVYVCAWHRNRGAAACPNGLRRPVASTDAAMIEIVRGKILREEVILEALRHLRARLAEEARGAATEEPSLQAEARKVRGEIAKLGDALLATDQAPRALVQMMAEREKRLTAIEGRLAAMKAAPAAVDLSLRRMEEQARRALADLDGLLAADTASARRVIEAVSGGPLTFTPTETQHGKRYQVAGTFGLDWAFTIEGVPSGSLAIVNPTGDGISWSFAA